MSFLFELTDIAPYSWTAIAYALFCGFCIGLDRQYRGKPVGIRTSIVIVLGTYFFVSTSALVQPETLDQTRVIGQVVSGIGFLGAGIMLSREGTIIGVTSAAAIWLLASLGVMIAVGYGESACKFSVLVVVILYGATAIEKMLMRFNRKLLSSYRKFKQQRKHYGVQTDTKQNAMTSD